MKKELIAVIHSLSPLVQISVFPRREEKQSQLKSLTTGLFYVSSPQRLYHRVLHQLVYQHVCGLCNLLYCRLHGERDKETHRRRSSFR